MKQGAFHGLAGELVEILEPHTEADPAGLLLTFLSAFGAAVGPGPNSIADGSVHPARLNVVLVGRSARARKGTSWSVIRRVFEHADPAFISSRVIGGLASGEGLISDLARRGAGLDRSVLVVEPEFARLLRVAARSATLSGVVREAWDGGDLAVLTRKEPLRAKGANVAIVGHVTAEELRRRLSDTEIAGGTGNRFLFAWVERSKRLPSGGQLQPDELDVLGVRVGMAIDRARELGTMVRSAEAERRWAVIYEGIDDDVTGVVGSLAARAEAQMLRLSVTYAMLDGSETIEVVHLDAAEAVWQHCEATIAKVFAGREADVIVPRLLAALETAGSDGLDGTEQRDLFGRHVTGGRLAGARAELETRNLAHTTTVETGGRPRIVTRLAAVAPAPTEVRSLLSQLSSQRPGPAEIASVARLTPLTSGVSLPDGSLTEGRS
jgi:hypothetical protein